PRVVAGDELLDDEPGAEAGLPQPPPQVLQLVGGLDEVDLLLARVLDELMHARGGCLRDDREGEVQSRGRPGRVRGAGEGGAGGTRWRTPGADARAPGAALAGGLAPAGPLDGGGPVAPAAPGTVPGEEAGVAVGAGPGDDRHAGRASVAALASSSEQLGALGP